MPHLLVTNDFPPKVGGIQTYLWELWRRLPPDEVTVLTAGYDGDRAFDAAQPFRVERTRRRVLLPTPALARRVERLAAEVGADLVVLDPVLPVGLLGRVLRRPYAVVLHGAEVTVPARLPLASTAVSRVVSGAARVIAAGQYPSAEAARVTGASMPTTTVVPPGVDAQRFRPLDPDARAAARRSFSLPEDGLIVVAVTRLVPRKGVDVLVEAAARLAADRPSLAVVVAGSGRDRGRLQRLVRESGAPVTLLGAVTGDRLPALYACADVFALPCRNRWGGLEQEGFGIVFAEAAACGVPQVAGDSGGVRDAVVDGETGIVVRRPGDDGAVAVALARLLDDGAARSAMGAAARRRAESELSYDVLASRLAEALSVTPAR